MGFFLYHYKQITVYTSSPCCVSLAGNRHLHAFCHTGYTGTSLVCDPATETYLIILTNRAHPHDKGACKPVRQKLAEIVFAPHADPGRP